ncbi:MAG: type II toxin-antitoxin system PemK/MazF family toxin [Intrasporangium sp.]|nr:hypothetical protein [Intrasporangium sp.]MDN5794794.1 type II toxin-antitoxin system PemK/MazF family toxin [Intrasporangium sp.]
MRRGQLWTATGGKHYASKPRPVLVVQDDRFDATMLALSRALVVFLGIA